MTRFIDPPPYGDDGGLRIAWIALAVFIGGALLETLFGWAADLWDSIATYALHLWHLIA